RIYPPYNVMTLAFAVFFLRFVAWWRQTGLGWSRGLDPRIHQLILWHVWPMLVGFLVPNHIRDFLAYLTRDHGRDGYDHPILRGLPYYAESLAHDYHIAIWSVAIAVALMAIAFVAWRKLKPGGAAVLWLVVIAGFLTCCHPAHRSRFMHSWIA